MQSCFIMRRQNDNLTTICKLYAILKHNKLRPIIFASIFLFYACGQRDPLNTNSNDKEVPEFASEKNSAADAALTFINAYVENCNKLKESTDILLWVNSCPMVTKEFKLELKKLLDDAHQKDSVMGLDADPIFAAQDYPDQGFVLDSADSNKSYLTLRGKNWSEFKLTMKLKNEEGKWLVDGCGIINMPEEKRK